MELLKDTPVFEACCSFMQFPFLCAKQFPYEHISVASVFRLPLSCYKCSFMRADLISSLQHTDSKWKDPLLHCNLQSFSA